MNVLVTLLSQQRANLIQVLVFVPGFVSVVNVAHRACPVDDNRNGHGLNFVELTHIQGSKETNPLYRMDTS